MEYRIRQYTVDRTRSDNDRVLERTPDWPIDSLERAEDLYLYIDLKDDWRFTRKKHPDWRYPTLVKELLVFDLKTWSVVEVLQHDEYPKNFTAAQPSSRARAI